MRTSGINLIKESDKVNEVINSERELLERNLSKGNFPQFFVALIHKLQEKREISYKDSITLYRNILSMGIMKHLEEIYLSLTSKNEDLTYRLMEIDYLYSQENKKATESCINMNQKIANIKRANKEMGYEILNEYNMLLIRMNSLSDDMQSIVNKYNDQIKEIEI